MQTFSPFSASNPLPKTKKNTEAHYSSLAGILKTPELKNSKIIFEKAARKLISPHHVLTEEEDRKLQNALNTWDQTPKNERNSLWLSLPSLIAGFSANRFMPKERPEKNIPTYNTVNSSSNAQRIESAAQSERNTSITTSKNRRKKSMQIDTQKEEEENKNNTRKKPSFSIQKQVKINSQEKNNKKESGSGIGKGLAWAAGGIGILGFGSGALV